MTSHAEELRRAMRQWATGVTVVSVYHDGQHHGMTVSSFTSLSLEPALVLISLEQVTKTHKLVQAAGTFAVTILGQHMQDVSDTFAGRVSDIEDRFAGLETFTLITGAPLLTSGLAWFDCRVVATYPAGTHTVYIGEVLQAKTNTRIEETPLLYYDRGYRRMDSG